MIIKACNVLLSVICVDCFHYDDDDIFVNCKWVATRWQLYSTHLHTNNTQNDTKQTIHRTAQNYRIIKSNNRTNYSEQYLVKRANCVASQSIINIASVLRQDDKRTGV
jgi:hypothetical protein